MEEIFNQIKAQCATFLADAEKAIFKGNKAAGVLAAYASLELAESLKAFSKELLK